MKKSLFADNQQESWTNEASKVCHDVRVALAPVFKKWIEQGYKVRDIQYAITAEIDIMSLEHIL